MRYSHMTRYKHKMTGSVPANRRDAVNAALQKQLGCGPDTMSIPIENGRGQIVRYGTAWQMTSEEMSVFKQILSRGENQGDARENEHIDKHAKRLGFKRKRKRRLRAVAARPARPGRRRP